MSGSRLPRRARPAAGHPFPRVAWRSRLLGPLSASIGDFPQNPVIPVSFARPNTITKGDQTPSPEGGSSTKHHHQKGWIFDQTPSPRTSSKQVPTYQVQASPLLLEISPGPQTPGLASAARSQLRPKWNLSARCQGRKFLTISDKTGRPVPADVVSRGTSKSSVSRRFVAKTTAQLRAWQSAPLDGQQNEVCSSVGRARRSSSFRPQAVVGAFPQG